MADTNDFDAAKTICDQLSGMEKDRQQRILRWVAESLDLVLHVRTASHDTTSKPGAQADAEPVVAPPVQARSPDIKTFVESKKPKSDVQFATVVAYYYRFEASPSTRRETITSDVLQEATRFCARERFKSPIMTLNNAKNQGYLDSPSKGEFTINSVGENLVAMALPGGEAAADGKRRKPAKKRAEKARASRKR